MMTFYLNERFVVFIVFVLINLVFRLWSFYEYFKNISCQVKKKKKKKTASWTFTEKNSPWTQLNLKHDPRL